MLWGRGATPPPTSVKKSGSEFLTIVGSYICHEGIPATLKVYINDDGKLMGETSMGPMDMVYCGETWFQGLRNGDVANRMRFYIRDNKAWSVMVGSRVWERIED